MCTHRLELDADLESAFRRMESILEGGCAHLVVNLRGLPFLTSSTLGYFAQMNATLAERGGGLLLTEPAPRVERVLAMVGLDEVIRVFPSDGEALRHAGDDCPSAEAAT